MTNAMPLVKISEFITKNCVLALFPPRKSMENSLFYNGQNSEHFEIDFLTRKNSLLLVQNIQKEAELPNFFWGGWACFLSLSDFVDNLGGI